MPTYHWARHTEGETDDIEKVPNGAIVDYIDGTPCIGRCEDCGTPVAEDEPHHVDSDGIVLCEGCSTV